MWIKLLLFITCCTKKSFKCFNFLVLEWNYVPPPQKVSRTDAADECVIRALKKMDDNGGSLEYATAQMAEGMGMIATRSQ